MTVAIVLLLAAERSGTHLLRSLLAKVPGVKAPGEIANAASGTIRTADVSFFRFRQEEFLANPDLFFATNEGQWKLLDRYFAALRAAHATKRLLVLDVKYAHVHNFNGPWWDPVSRPLLLEYARKSRIRIVHLVRSKVYRTVISQFYAQQSGIYRARDSDQLKSITIEVSPDNLELRARQLAETIRLFESWLEPCEHLRITYEGLTADGRPTLGTLRDFLELDGDIPQEPGFVKTMPPYDRAIANYTDIAHLLDVDVASLPPHS